MKMFTKLGTLAALMALAFLFNPDILRAQNYRGWVEAAEDGRACSLHGVAGEWGYTITGTLILPTGPSLLATVGKYTIDAEGHVSATQTTSKGGNIFEETVKGTLTVNSDCTGTLTVSVYDPSGTTLDRTGVWAVVFVDNEREFRAILKSVALEPGSTSTPPIATEDAKKLFPCHVSEGGCAQSR